MAGMRAKYEPRAHICGGCGQTFTLTRQQVRRLDVAGRNGVYCSAACAKVRYATFRPPNWQQVERPCGTCGRLFWLQPAKVKPVNYCSRACAKAHNVATLPRMYRDEHPAWVGDEANSHTARARAIKWFAIQPCELCGEQPIQKARNVHRHHKDRNPENNDSSNIAFLCRRHHAAAHRALRQQEQTAT